MQHLMTKYRTQQANDEKGFTLIELLVVIVILGILAAVVVFSVGGIQDRGKESACDATKKTLITASEAYRAQNDVYASSLQGLSSLAKELPASGNVVDSSGVSLTYVPATGNVTGDCSTLAA